MAYIQAFIKNNLQAIDELLPLVKKQCGGCLPLALTFEESVQRCPEFRDRKNFILSLMTCEHADSFHEETFVDVWVINSLKENETSESKAQAMRGSRFEEIEPLTIYLTSELREYPFLTLNKDNGEKCILLRDVTPIPLQRITIGALSIDSFEWAAEHLSSFLMNIIDNRLVVIKQNGNLGEVFVESELHDMLSMLIVLDTVPVMQGLVTEDTSLVISDIHRDDLKKWQLKRLKSMQGGGKVPHLPLIKIPGPRSTQLQVPRLINLDEPDAGFFEGHHHEILNTLGVFLLETPFKSRNLTVIDEIADVDNQIWITRATMFEMELNNGSWVRCRVNEDPKTNKTRSKFPKIRIAQVFPIEEHPSHECIWQSPHTIKDDEEEFHNGIAYVSPVFMFNLLSSPFEDIKTIQLCIERAELGESPPCHAKEINVSVVASPVTKITNMYDCILTKHFCTARLVSVGDVLSIYCDWKDLEPPNTPVALDEGLPRDHVLYVRVNKVTGNEESFSYFVVATHSKLSQNESLQSYIPSSAELFVHNCVKRKLPISSYWLTSHPGGLDDFVSKLETTLRSLLHTSSTSEVFPVLLSGPVGVGKKTVVMATSRRLNLHVVEVNCYKVNADTTAATEARMRNHFQKAFSCAPCILLLTNIHCLGKDKDNHDKEPRIITTLMLNLREIQRVSQHPVIVLGTTSNVQNMTSDLRSCFSDEFEIEAPTENQRVEMLQSLSTGFLVGPGVSFKALASRTAGMVLSDFCTMFSEAVIQAKDDVMGYIQALQLPPQEEDENGGYQNQAIKLQRDVCSAGILLHQVHFDKAIQVLQAAHADSIGAPKIPNVCWKDIGGLGDVKREIMDTIQLPFQYPELFAAGLQRSGILLYGPPGTGKTLVAKAVATECSLNFLSVKGPELINMYVGQSEENVREIFATASRAAPCVIFFDELDSLAPNRGRSGDSGGVMDRVVSQLLAELDGLKRSRDVFVIGATNRPDLLDPALLRPGRFDKLLYLGITKEKEDRLKIMKALTRKFDLPEDINLGDVVDMCPGNLTGADFYALCSNALLNAIRRQIEHNTGAEKAELTQQDFEVAIEDLVPSVSNEELMHYEKIQWEFNKNKLAEKEIDPGELELDGQPETDL